MSQYLDKAAELIAKAAGNNQKWFGTLPVLSESAQYQENAIRLADAYAALAAIEQGLIPADLVQHVLDAWIIAKPDAARMVHHEIVQATGEEA